MEQDAGRRRTLARYKPDISLGNILTASGMAAAVIIWGMRLEGRVDKQQEVSFEREKTAVERQKNNDLRFQYVEDNLRQQRDDTARFFKDVHDSLLRIENKLEKKADKP